MEDHSKTIIHIDIDCFYAQVEIVRNPALANQPVGIKQKNIVVTSNYIAREYGIKKCMLITEAKKLCPKLILVNGEDLYHYRQISYKVTLLLQTYSETVERLGLDENFIDITDLVDKRLTSLSSTKPVGCMFGDTEVLCDCGCAERISVGSQIAEEIRNQIYEELKLTVCAGIAHNKLLAKIVGSKNKPNKQTLVFPNNAAELMLSLELVKNIPWIGNVTAEQLSTVNIIKVIELQNCSIEKLKNIFSYEKAQTIWNLSFGVDDSNVKKSGKPQSIGLEDSCKAMTTEKDIEGKLKCLLRRLIILVNEDGRIPKTIKLTVRKFDHNHNTQPQASIRETRQCNIKTSLKDEAKIMNIVMALFRKTVNTNKKFNITLLGLSFTKFGEKPSVKNTLTNFFSKEVEVQSVADNNNRKISPCAEPSISLFKKENSKFPDKSLKSNNFVITNKTLECLYSSIPTITNSTDSQSDSAKKYMCPPDINEEVFRELPRDIQEELLNDYIRKNEVEETQRPHKKMRPNSILNYVVKEQK